jgi:hypothetical protein
MKRLTLLLVVMVGLAFGYGAIEARISSVTGGGGATAGVSDTAYNATTWDGVTDTAPSKNAVRDKIETLGGSGDITTVGECATGDCTDDFINGTDIADDAIDSEHYTDGSIDAAHLNTTQDWSSFTISLPPISSSDWIDGGDIADDAIDSEHYVAASIDNEHLADNAVGTAEIATDAVTMDSVDADGDFTSLTGDWATTGTINGAVKITTDADGHSVTGAEAYGGLIVETGNQQTVTLPSAVLGMSVCVLADGADESAEVYVDCDAGDHFEYDGTAMANGEYIYNDSDLKGDRMCFVAIDTDTWVVTYGGDTTVAEETP